MTYQGKEVFTSDDFDYASAKPGDYVEEAVVDAAMNCLPPICMSSACAQMGGPLWYAPGPYNRGMEIHLRHIQALSGCLRYLGVLWPLFFGRDRRARDAATLYVTHQIK